MGGIGSGGHAAAGRKPKDRRTAFVHGQRGAKAQQAAANAPEAVAIPADLPVEQREVWTSLAPFAVQARTLTKATAQAFRDLCEAIVVKRSMLERIREDGMTYLKVTVDGAGQEHTEVKAHPLISQHRGMMQRVEAGMTRFRLAPIGKEMVTEEPAADPFAEFDEGTVQ